MLHNFVRTIFRHLGKNKLYTFINIAGLALGFAAFILISAHVLFEKSYDNIHTGTGKVYRVESRFYKNNNITDDWPTSTNGYATAMKQNFPEIASFTRINWHNSERVVRYKDIKYREDHVCFADSNFFSFFSYPLLKGDAATVLQEVNSVVISESSAIKYFGTEEPVGKFLDIATVSDKYHCMVTGVFKDLPANSTMQFNMLMSWNTTPLWERNFWYLHESYTYVTLAPGTTAASVENKFPALAETYKTGESLKELKWAIHLVPLQDIHLNAAKPYEIEVKGNRNAVLFLTVIAIVILVIAWINYINLATARSLERAKEIGIRKVSGAYRSQLAVQFLLESFTTNIIALLLAIILVIAGQYAATALTDGTISFLFNKQLLLQAGIIFLAGVMASGFYPALVLSGMQPVVILKGKYTFSKGGTVLRKGLVILQFACSLILIAGTFAVYRQMVYMNNQHLGVDIHQTLVIKSPVNTTDYARKTESFKNQLQSLSGVRAVTHSGAVPGKEVGKFLANRRYGASKLEERTYEMLKVDHNYINAYNLEIIAGHAFDKNNPADSFGVVLNESSVKQFGFASAEKAIGERVWLEVNPGRPNTVIGVIRDYHQQSLQQKYTPLILFMDPAYGWIPAAYYSVKVNTSNLPQVIAGVQQAWNNIFPESSFDYFFLNDFFDRQYRQDRQFGKIFLLFSCLAIFIACMGLFGLTAYSTARRMKEIGIRKVSGASVQSIMLLLSKDTLKLIAIAAVVAIPVAVYSTSQWLQHYAFRTSLAWWQFVLPLLFLCMIALLTISYLTFRAAMSNPVKMLRHE